MNLHETTTPTDFGAAYDAPARCGAYWLTIAVPVALCGALVALVALCRS